MEIASYAIDCRLWTCRMVSPVLINTYYKTLQCILTGYDTNNVFYVQFSFPRFQIRLRIYDICILLHRTIQRHILIKRFWSNSLLGHLQFVLESKLFLTPMLNKYRLSSSGSSWIIYWGHYKMADILQTTYCSTFPFVEIIIFWYRFPRSKLPGAQNIKNQYL